MPDESIQIRLATAADRDAITALQLASWRDSYTAELSEAYLRDDLPAELKLKWAGRRFGGTDLTMVSEFEGQITGFVCALTDRPVPLIDNLHVHPKMRGGGIGARLLQVVRDVLWVEGHGYAYLTVLESNPRALAFYLEQGGVDGGQVEDMLVGHPVRARRIDFKLG